MKAFKLIRQMKDGQLSPLFINRKSRIPMNIWMEAEFHSTKGFADRKGWHCCLKQEAPHLAQGGDGAGKDRVWVEVEVEDYELFNRPKSQGGVWVLAERMKIIKIL